MNYPSHRDELERLRKIEGQIRGVQKMIEGGRYCVDILRVISAVRGALQKVEKQIFERHLHGCFTKAIQSASSKEKESKMQEVMALITHFRN